ncbi:hypothetical protein K490DRAFT_32490 [Saccharata proteae CBS 121410]|uniref:Uncharacterized protein n=1 Tax=Saccharata proteae CBS 121410 TaxID=1314787 RepID=A0A9P4LZ51_9PEZI|nr:hypothetical protein K490DRAFT_32490 [Saccharata proteae CBS 121410]
MSGEYQLSIILYDQDGESIDGSHWGLIFHMDDSEVGNLFHVTLLDPKLQVYQLDQRHGYLIHSKNSSGYFNVARISQYQCVWAAGIIEKETIPVDATATCKEWVLNCLISLEVEELVPAGTSLWLEPLLKLPLEDIVDRLEDKWHCLKS